MCGPGERVVLRLLHESDALVPAGEPLLEIGDPAQTEIVADLLSTDAARVAAGAPVASERWGGEHALEARVRRVEVAIELWRGDDVLKLASGALFHRGDERAAFRVDSGRARLVLVVIGHRTATEVEVTSGLSAGDAVIVYPPDTLTNGSRVEVR
jgi:HlyD family secretion protein